MAEELEPLKPASMPSYPGQTSATPQSSSQLEDGPTSPDILVPTEERQPLQIPFFLRMTGWVAFALGCLVFFTLAKLPEDRIKSLVQGNLSAILGARDMSLTAAKSKLNVGFGISYVMSDVTLNLPPPSEPAHIDRIEFSPSLFKLLLGKIGGKVSIQNADSELLLSGTVKDGQFSGELTADRFDLGKIGLLKAMTGVSGGAVVTGRLVFSANAAEMTSAEASAQIDLQKIKIDPQTIMGFSLPAIAVSQGHIDLDIDHGKGELRTFRLGRSDSASDDLKADLSGQLVFGKTLSNSTCNIKANFSFSAAIMKSFAILDALLAAGKQPDGSYSYRLTGPLLSPNPIPGSA